MISSSVILSDAFDLHLSDLVDRQPVCRTSDRSDEGYLLWVMLRLGAVIWCSTSSRQTIFWLLRSLYITQRC
jgi:hypothetical protein